MREELIFYPRTEVFNSSGEVELRPFACIMAVKIDDTFRLGWSMCNSKDTFDKNKAKLIARGRALSAHTKEVPETLKHAMDYMADRAARYFK